MRRREFINVTITLAAAWPLSARAQQQRETVRHLGILMNLSADDPEGTARLGAFLQAMQELGWSIGRNLRIETRWGAGDTDRYRRYAAELVSLKPDMILAANGPIAGEIQRVDRTIPVVFANAVDPVSGGWVSSLSRPGGNATGFFSFELGMSTKWLELLKEIAPNLKRVAFIRDPATPAGAGEFGAIQAMASSTAIELIPIDARDPKEIERALTEFAKDENVGVIAASGSRTQINRELIIRLAAKYRLPAVYPFRFFATAGGLISYGPDQVEPFRRAAAYVDRVLRGEKPSELPVQAASKFELVVNLRTAKALGITLPQSLVARADDVIE